MSAVDFLFTPSMQRVLSATLSHPERAYTLEELLSLADAGRGNTQKQIERLLVKGVLKETATRASAEHQSEYGILPVSGAQQHHAKNVRACRASKGGTAAVRRKPPGGIRIWLVGQGNGYTTKRRRLGRGGYSYVARAVCAHGQSRARNWANNSSELV
jgi:hypothetical protein